MSLWAEREWRRRMVPAGTVLCGSLLMAVPLPLALPVVPNLALLLVLVWASVQPRLMPVWAAFLLGLFHDVIAAVPFGLFALLFALTVIAVRTAEQQLEVRSIAIDWAMAAALVLLLHALMWQLLAILGQDPPAGPIAAQALLTALAFPLSLAAAAFVHRRLVEQAP